MDWISSITSLLGSYFVAEKRLIAFPILMLGNVFWIIYFVNLHSIPSIGMNLVYMGMNIYSWYRWKHKK